MQWFHVCMFQICKIPSSCGHDQLVEIIFIGPLAGNTCDRCMLLLASSKGGFRGLVSFKRCGGFVFHPFITNQQRVL